MTFDDGEKVKVLDHGYVRLVEAWGSDMAIVEAARMSTSKGFLGWDAESTWRCDLCNYAMYVDHNDKARIVEHSVPYPIQSADYYNIAPEFRQTTLHRMKYVEGHDGDLKLLRYLWQHKHHTPFEMAGITIEVQAPIFVFREWHRHRTQSYNEMSARYVPMPDVNYVPSDARLVGTTSHNERNKQAGSVKGSEALTASSMSYFQEQLREAYEDCESLYQSALGRGVPKELSRLCIPVGRYSKMRASANLRNWLGFLALRLPATAQWETRQYAEVVSGIIMGRFPRVHQLFSESKQALENYRVFKPEDIDLTIEGEKYVPLSDVKALLGLL